MLPITAASASRESAIVNEIRAPLTNRREFGLRPRVERMQRPLTQPVSHTQRPQSPVEQTRCAGAGSSLRTDALDYHLPVDRIATHPVEPRDSARMLVMWRSDESRIEHRHVRDLPEYLHRGDALVFNNTAVAPARLEMRRASGGRVEGLFLSSPAPRLTAGDLEWTIMLRSGGRVSVGDDLVLVGRDGHPGDLLLSVLAHDGDEWTVAVKSADGRLLDTSEVLDRVGRTPLPPYIVKARSAHHESYADAEDQRWYQTVYADAAHRHSVAAPTAGLHFTPELLHKIETIGVQRVDVTLHVGPGTFKPVTAATLGEHRMHDEWFEIGGHAIDAIKHILEARHEAHSHPRPLGGSLATGARERGDGRIIAVGTTSVRALESLPDAAFTGESCGSVCGSTDLLIAPGHVFRHLDGMLTNFHLPRSTLLALVAAMVGLERLLAVYREAIDRGYRFYSYGDCMLILP
jgi:S-adenosylmethionine:tRNA ribosyltransferase-isomerase